MNKLRLLLLLFVLIFANDTYAQQGIQNDLILPYLVHKPEVIAAHPPLLILMHGYGSNEQDLFDLKDRLPRNFIIIAVRAPIKTGINAFQWFGMETIDGMHQGNRKDIQSSVAKMKVMIPALVKKYNADARRVYLCGFSQGGMMSYEIGLTSPELLTGIAPLSGRLFEALKPRIKITPALKKLRMFIGHGEADNRVAYHFAEEAHAYLTQSGLTPVLHPYKHLQHAISQEEIGDIARWLNGQ